MANSYIAIPNVLPGNVTIGGNLTVAGNELTVGSFAAKLHLAMDAINIAKLTYNIKQGGNTRDDVSRAGVSLGLPYAGTQPELQVINSAGNSMDNALLAALFTDYTAHSNTGNTTENTIYTKTVRANLLGANGGLRVSVRVHVGNQGAAASTIRVKVGATTVQTFTVVTGDQATSGYRFDVVIFNANNASSQDSYGEKFSGSGFTVNARGFAAVATTADWTLSITAQDGTNTDILIFEFCAVEFINTYGPVT